MVVPAGRDYVEERLVVPPSNVEVEVDVDVEVDVEVETGSRGESEGLVRACVRDKGGECFTSDHHTLLDYWITGLLDYWITGYPEI